MANDKEQGASRVSREETSTHKKKSTRDPSVPRASSQEWEACLAKVELVVGDLRDDSAKLMEVTETVEELEGKDISCEGTTEELRNEVLVKFNEFFTTFRQELAQLKDSLTVELEAVKEDLRGNLTTQYPRIWIMERTRLGLNEESKGDGSKRGKSSKSFTCFLCDKEGHSARMCPQRSKLNAMIATMEEKELENEGRMGAMRLEEEAKLANL
ncbi:E3 ubiquitin-protein ligase RBBP6 [Bienertia sinuspersici]